MKIQGESPEKILIWSISRTLINSAKDTLNILEDLKADGLFNEEYFQRLRKRILGNSNDKIREFEQLIGKFDIKLKE